MVQRSEERSHLFEEARIGLVVGADVGSVDVDLADHLPIGEDRHHDLGTGGAEARQVARIGIDVLVTTRANDASNNPVWNPGAPDIMTLGGNGVALDDLRIYNQVFTVAEQCMYIVKGTWTGSACTLP